MDDYAVLIPSYHRAERQSTLELICGAYQTSRIVIGTQCREDYQEYSDRYSDKSVIVYKEGDSVGHNRNTLLEYCCSQGINKAVMLDDDIRGFVFADKKEIRTAKDVRFLIDSCMTTATQRNAMVWGTYPVANPFMMRQRVSNSMLTGTCMGIMDTRLRFDASFRVKEDYELSLRIINKGGLSLRFNNLAPIAGHKTKGGCEKDWHSDVYIAYADLLITRYPKLVTYSHKQGEVKMIRTK